MSPNSLVSIVTTFQILFIIYRVASHITDFYVILVGKSHLSNNLRMKSNIGKMKAATADFAGSTILDSVFSLLNIILL